jgi:PAS domain S-box-containing protein
MPESADSRRGDVMHTSGWVWHREAVDGDAREDAARLRAVLGHCPTRIAVLDEDGNLVGYNKEFTRLFATPPPLGEPVAQLFEEGQRAMLAEVVARAGTSQHAGAIVTLHSTASTLGEERDLEVLVATLPGEGVRSIGVVMVTDDRTERTRAENERSFVAGEIGEANVRCAIDLTQAAIYHDINNVLTTLTITLGTLRARSHTKDPQAEGLIGELLEAVKHAGEIVARTRRSALTAAPLQESTDARESVERATLVVAPLARRARVAIATHVVNDSRLPLHGSKVIQALTNLLTNSIHAIEEAGHPGRIDITVERSPSDAAVIRVHDDGVGIDPSRLVDSFDVFQTTRAERGGTGLGLAIAREIIETAGGHINVLSTPGRGTEMRIELPVVGDGEERELNDEAEESAQ